MKSRATLESPATDEPLCNGPLGTGENDHCREGGRCRVERLEQE